MLLAPSPPSSTCNQERQIGPALEVIVLTSHVRGELLLLRGLVLLLLHPSTLSVSDEALRTPLRLAYRL
ncbi:hypothetical protein ABKN59_007771 [Abortiporus biennis]